MSVRFRIVFDSRGRGSKYRDKKTGRWTKHVERKEFLWRYSYGIKWAAGSLSHPIPVHGKYYGALVQAWSESREDVDTDRLKGRLLDALEDFLGYKRSQWEGWFVIDDGEGFQRVGYSSQLEDEWRLRIEASSGRAVVTDSGSL